ncbi:MAG: glycosyltransferase [Candidatus Omnitrophica bacterium]|nr:glycosyltransferase [Candidatus Omnitrophota bacterium]
MQDSRAEDQKITVDVVIPVCNEENLLEQSVNKLIQILSGEKELDWRILIASNGSTDMTKKIGEGLAKTCPRVSFFHISKRGRGRALRKAFGESKASVCFYTDVDLAVDINTLPTLTKEAFRRQGVAMPNRLGAGTKNKRPYHRILFSRLYNVFIRILFPKTVIRDAQVGMKAVYRGIIEEFLKKTENNGFFFDTELLLMAEKAGRPIVQIPADCYDMRRGNARIVPYVLEASFGLMKMRINLFRCLSKK